MVAHEARLRELAKDGSSIREHLQAAADRGRQVAIDKLNGPAFPDALAYLYGWLLELDGARSVGMNGLESFTFQMVESWARLTDRSPEPHEVDALMYLGRVFLYPPKEEE